jgi:16S rRNA processing protein RimM
VAEQSSQSRASAGDRIAVGRINATWGLNGHVKVTPLTSNEGRFVAGAELIVAGRRVRILEVVSPQGYPMIRFEGYEDRAAAERLRGELIEIEPDELPELPDGEYYIDDLRGLAVVSSEGDPIGILADVLTTGANDVYVVRREGERDVLIPAIPDVVLAVDLDARRMVVEVLPGLID